MLNLKSLVKNKISNKKSPISFRDYMQECLYNRSLGYYTSGKEKISSEGDFITLSSSSSLFAKVMAKQFSGIFANIENPVILEFGAGNGNFAVGCILELESLGSLPSQYYILDLSNDLKERQKLNISKKAQHLLNLFRWVDEVPNDIQGVVFANEVIDAMPVDVFKSSGGKLIQQGVNIFNNELDMCDLDSNDKQFQNMADKILADNISFEDEYTSELNIWVDPWIKTISESLKRGCVFIFDYGYHRDLYYTQDRSMGTLSCYKDHKVNFDPFINIGEQDITSHVDFTAIAEAVDKYGMVLDGYMTQSSFLKNAGITQVFEKVYNEITTDLRIKYSADFKRIMLDDKLSDVFKVMCFSNNFKHELSVFDNDDNIDYLL